MNKNSNASCSRGLRFKSNLNATEIHIYFGNTFNPIMGDYSAHIICVCEWVCAPTTLDINVLNKYP